MLRGQRRGARGARQGASRAGSLEGREQLVGVEELRVGVGDRGDDASGLQAVDDRAGGGDGYAEAVGGVAAGEDRADPQLVEQLEDGGGGAALREQRAVVLVQVAQGAGAAQGVARLVAHAEQEEAQPGRPVARVGEREQLVVVLGAAALEVGTEVEQRRAQHAALG